MFIDLKTALVLIEECKKINIKLTALRSKKTVQDNSSGSVERLKQLTNQHDTITPVLDICEFRCKILLNSSESELVHIIERCENISALETIASMAMQTKQRRVEGM